MTFVTGIHAHLALKLHKAKEEAGFVYCVRNMNMPHLVKIGVTRNSVATRMKGLEATYPRPLVLLCAIEVKHIWAVEKALHSFFDFARVDDGREFFRLEDDQVHNVFQMCDEVDGVQ